MELDSRQLKYCAIVEKDNLYLLDNRLIDAAGTMDVLMELAVYSKLKNNRILYGRVNRGKTAIESAYFNA